MADHVRATEMALLRESASVVTEWAGPEERRKLEAARTRTHLGAPSGNLGSNGPGQDGATSPAESPRSNQEQAAAPPKLHKKKSQRDLKNVGKKGKDNKDIFKQFLKDVEAEKDAKRAGNEAWQEDARKRLGNLHRTTKLLLELSDDTELKDKKYTNNGHKVMMQGFLAENRSRSDPQLMKEARRAGASPEVFQVRKYNKDLYVKPKTPPQPAPKEPPKMMLDAGLASLLARPTLMENPFA